MLILDRVPSGGSYPLGGTETYSPYYPYVTMFFLYALIQGVFVLILSPRGPPGCKERLPRMAESDTPYPLDATGKD
jgi:hypothetical protein